MIVAEPLRTSEDYERALKEIDVYFKSPPEPGTEAADRFDRLTGLIKEYEDANFPIPAKSNIARDELIDRFEQGLMLASDKQYILALLRLSAGTLRVQYDIDDIVSRLTDHSLYTKAERNKLFVEARDEITRLRRQVAEIDPLRHDIERHLEKVALLEAQVEGLNYFEKNEAGTIDWKMEAERANRLLAQAETQLRGMARPG